MRGRKALVKVIVECKGPKDTEKRIFMDTPRNVKRIINKTRSEVYRFLLVEKPHFDTIKDEQDMGILLDNSFETQKVHEVEPHNFNNFFGVWPKLDMDEE